MSNNSTFAWACSKLREAVEVEMHGNLVISLQAGKIRKVEIQKFELPPIDETF